MQHFAIPEALRHEHEELHGRVAAATKLPGRTGEAARELAQVLHPHVVRERQIVLPSLALLGPLAAGAGGDGMTEVLPLTDAVRAELPHMLEEHRLIAGASRRLRSAAQLEGQATAAALADEMLAHIEMEEQVMYPAAILVGEVLRARGTSEGASPPS